MVPPYVSHVRCVIWAAADGKAAEAAASAALSFRLMLDDGREVIVEPTGAAARLSVRTRVVYQHEVREDEAPRMTIGRRNTYESRLKRESRAIAWVAVGDTVSVRGRLVGTTRPFAGNQFLAAEQVVVGGGKLHVGSLTPGEAEP
jgi:hypothetical protein